VASGRAAQRQRKLTGLPPIKVPGTAPASGPIGRAPAPDCSSQPTAGRTPLRRSFPFAANLPAQL